MAKKMTTRTIVNREKEKVTVYGTEKSVSMKTGQSYMVSKTLADTVVKKGEATLKKK